jgi:hypothetical protein
MHGDIGNLGVKSGDTQHPLSLKQTKGRKDRKPKNCRATGIGCFVDKIW